MSYILFVCIYLLSCLAFIIFQYPNPPTFILHRSHPLPSHSHLHTQTYRMWFTVASCIYSTAIVRMVCKINLLKNLSGLQNSTNSYCILKLVEQGYGKLHCHLIARTDCILIADGSLEDKSLLVLVVAWVLIRQRRSVSHFTLVLHSTFTCYLHRSHLIRSFKDFTK